MYLAFAGQSSGWLLLGLMGLLLAQPEPRLRIGPQCEVVGVDGGALFQLAVEHWEHALHVSRVPGVDGNPHAREYTQAAGPPGMAL